MEVAVHIPDAIAPHLMESGGALARMALESVALEALRAGPITEVQLRDMLGLARIGETAAIALAEFLRADLLLIDERDGYGAAQRRGLSVTGTLGLLDLAAERGLIDFAHTIRSLKQTTFRRPEALLEILLEKHSGGED
jgi:predicted nucleic acid-binding protein